MLPAVCAHHQPFRIAARAGRLFTVLVTVAFVAAPWSAAGMPVSQPARSTFVDASAPNRNYGHARWLEVAGEPARRALLRFAVPTVRLTGVSLRLYALHGSHRGIGVWAVSCLYGPDRVTWRSRPRLARRLGGAHRIRAGWNRIDLSLRRVSHTLLCLAITGSGRDTIRFSAVPRRHAARLLLRILQTRRRHQPPVQAHAPVPPPPAGPPSAQSLGCANRGTLWCGDFRTGSFSQYTEELGRPASGISFVTNPVLGSPFAMSVRLRPGDLWTDGTSRMQLRKFDSSWTEGADVYYHVDVYIDPSTVIGGRITNPWRVLLEWPTSEAGYCSNGGFQLATIDGHGDVVAGGTPALEMTGHNCTPAAGEHNYWWLLNPIQGAWYQFIVHRHYSLNPSVGFEEIWLKKPGDAGYLQQVLNGPAGGGQLRAHFSTLGCAGCHANLRVGIYRNKLFTTTDIIYYDDVRTANTLAAAG